MAASQKQSPSKAFIEELVLRNDRFELMKTITPRVPLGTRRFCDVRKVGAANPNSFKLKTSEWDERLKIPSDGRCKGMFCAAFNRKQLTRRCEVATDAIMCSKCALVRRQAKEDKSDVISLQGIAGYVTSKLALFKRKGVTQCIDFWHRESEQQ